MMKTETNLREVWTFIETIEAFIYIEGGGIESSRVLPP